MGGGNELPAAMRVDGITEIGQRLEWPPPIHVCGANELPAAMRVDGITEIGQRLEWPPPIHVGGGNEAPAAMRVDGITEVGQRLDWQPPIHVGGGNEVPAAMRVDGITTSTLPQSKPWPQTNMPTTASPPDVTRARPLGRRAAASGGECRFLPHLNETGVHHRCGSCTTVDGFSWTYRLDIVASARRIAVAN